MAYKIDETKIIYADLTPQEGVVLNLKTKNYYRLNETGQIIWQSLAAQKTREEIISSISAQYDAPIETVQADVDQIIQKFHKEQLIEMTNQKIPTFNVNEARKSKKEKPL